MLALLVSSLLLGTVPESPPPVTFALIVSNNDSHKLGRVPLEYADDDGAKYAEVFSMFVGKTERILLTRMDADTRALFPALSNEARPPTTVELELAAEQLAEKVAAAKRAGKETELYFVFAGHGDVENGRGFLELEDRPFDSMDLERLLQRVGAHRSHVILDSCNSFFVISPRKSGGKRYATPVDLTATVSKRLPNVGVMLSTSAEAEVYEWSELQSGVFSHVVRSGLMGAADADGDGSVTYRELEAFIQTASRDIPNPLLRPRVFALGPGRKGDVPLVRLKDAAGVEVSVDSSKGLRLSARDTRALRWLDLHTEAGTPMKLRIPSAVARSLEFESASASASGEGVVYRLPAEEQAGPVALLSLPPTRAGSSTRGVQEQLRLLLASPFGPQALSSFDESERQRAPPVFGISSADEVRLKQLVLTFTEVERSKRREEWISFGGIMGIGVGRTVYAFLEPSPDATDNGLLAAASTLAIGALSYSVIAHQEHPESLLREFQKAEAEKLDPGRTIQRVDYQLTRFLGQERRVRRQQGTIGWLLVGLASIELLVGELLRLTDSPEEAWSLEVGALVTGISGTVWLLRSKLVESPSEILVRQWHADPLRDGGLQLGAVPVRGGAVVTLGLRF